jgi:hypothetical protein
LFVDETDHEIVSGEKGEVCEEGMWGEEVKHK